MIARFWREGGVEVEAPFPRLTYAEAMERYGSDKPDLRYGLEIEDVTEVSSHRVRSSSLRGRGVRSLPQVPQAFSRAELERLEDVAKEWVRRASRTVWDERARCARRSRSSSPRRSPRTSAAIRGYSVLFAVERVAHGLRQQYQEPLRLQPRPRAGT